MRKKFLVLLLCAVTWAYFGAEVYLNLTRIPSYSPPPSDAPPDFDKYPPTKWDAMDVGSFMSSGFGGKMHATRKGISIKLGDTNTAAICFDTELLRMTMGWTGGFLRLPRLLDGIEGTPWPGGRAAFITHPQPGWANNDSFQDPRPKIGDERFGPLPRNWAHYKGVYVHGEKVVLSYSVGNTDVLEIPEFETRGKQAIFTRSFELSNVETAMALHICDAPEGVTQVRMEGDVALLIRATDNAARSRFTAVFAQHNLPGAKLQVADTHAVRFRVPPAKTNATFRILICKGQLSDLTETLKILKTSRPIERVSSFIQGGPSRWPALTTKGIAGNQSGPYQIDLLTVPGENPWKSWIRPSGLDFFSDGRAALCSLTGDIWIVDGLNQSLETLTWKRFAAGLYQPLGLKIVNDTIYVTGRDQITRLHDLNNDDEADFYENFNNDVLTGSHYHEFCFGLETDSRGNFYFTKGGNLGAASVPHHGTLLKVSGDGKKMEIVADGFRAPNGVAISRRNEIIVSDNQGDWLPASRLNWVGNSGPYGNVDTSRIRDWTKHEKPLCWIPTSVDNSTGNPIWIESNRWGPWDGELLSTSFGSCSLFLVLPEIGNGPRQGGVVRFPLKFDTGIMRGRFNPRDGQLYLCGLSGWQTRATKDAGFYRLRYTGAPLRMPRELRIRPGSVEITFTEPVDSETALDEQNYAVEQWNYALNKLYNSDEVTVRNPSIPGRDTMEIKEAKVSSDGRTISLKISGLQPVMQMRIRYDISSGGAPIRGEIYNTINHVPAD